MEEVKKLREVLEFVNNEIGIYNTEMVQITELIDIIEKQLLIQRVSGSAFLYDELSKKPVKMWYVDEDGNYYIDTDPNGVDMSGKRRILPANKDRYRVHYR